MLGTSNLGSWNGHWLRGQIIYGGSSIAMFEYQRVCIHRYSSQLFFVTHTVPCALVPVGSFNMFQPIIFLSMGIIIPHWYNFGSSRGQSFNHGWGKQKISTVIIDTVNVKWWSTTSWSLCIWKHKPQKCRGRPLKFPALEKQQDTVDAKSESPVDGQNPVIYRVSTCCNHPKLVVYRISQPSTVCPLFCWNGSLWIAGVFPWTL